MIGSNVDFGARLKAERERLGLNQSDFGKLTGVSRNSQSAYEIGGTPAPLDYLRSLENAGVDIGYLLWGVRGGQVLSPVQLKLLACYDAVEGHDREALLTVAHRMAGLPSPPASVTLPSSEALEDAMSGLLDEGTNWTPAELVHEIARTLPIILRSAEHELAVPVSDHLGSAHELQSAAGIDQISSQRGKRT